MSTENTAAQTQNIVDQSSSQPNDSTVTNAGDNKHQTAAQNDMLSQEIERLKNESSSLSTENESLRKELAIMKSGVSSEYADDVTVLADQLAKNNGITFEDALKRVVKKYPMFTGEKQEIKPFIPFNPPPIDETDNSDGFTAGLRNFWKGSR